MEQNNLPCILYLCDYQAPYGGNFLASMAQLDDALNARNVSAVYVFPAGAKDRPWFSAWIAGKRQTKLLNTNQSLFKQVIALTAYINQTHATILHVHFGLFPLAELTALRCRNLRLILHFHSDFSAGKTPGLKDRLRDGGKSLLEWAIGKARITKITVSEASNRTTRDCISIHNALVPARFTADCWGRDKTRAALGLCAQQRLFLVFGWSPYIKGVDIAAQAVAAAHAAGHTEYMLGVVGGRTYTKEKMDIFLREKAGIRNNQLWYIYLEPTEDVFRYHLAADVFISASRSETFSYALLEALSVGKPCIISDIPGVAWAKDYPPVSTFASGDSASLADCLDSALQVDPTLCHATAQSVAKEFAIDQWVRALLSVYGLR